MNSKRRTLWSRMFAADAQTAGPLPAVPAGLASSMRPLALEQRFMFDGAGAVDAAHAAIDAGAHAAEVPTDGPLHALMAEAATAAAPAPRNEVIFIDAGVQDAAQLQASALPGTEVVLLDATRDGVRQIAEYLQGRSGIDAIHIISHGADGQVRLGAATLDQASLSTYTAELAAIGAGLTADGDILLYGCNIAADAQGQGFIAALAGATGADVAASSNATGAQALGGDWVLERQSGSIEAALPFDAQRIAGYGELLVSPSNGVTTFGTGGNDLPLATGTGNLGVTAANVAGMGWDVSVKTSTAADVVIARGDLLFGTGDGIYYARADGNGEQLQSFTVASNGAELFDLRSVEVTLAFPPENGTTSTRLTVTGLRNGVAVAGAVKQFDIAVANNQTELTTLNFADNANFAGITSFAMTDGNASGILYVGIDNLDVLNVRSASGPAPVTWSPGAAPLATAIGAPGRTVVGDFDGDGDTDILYQTGGNGSIWAYARSNGDGTFTQLTLAQSPFAEVTLPDHSNSNYYVGDFDGDGDVDVLVGVNGTTGTYLRNESGTFRVAPSVNFPSPAGGARMVVGDFDGDGDADILFQTGGNGSAFAYARSNGNGIFTMLPQSASPFAGLTLPDHAGNNYFVADFDGDGDADILATVSGQTGTFLRNDGAAFSSVSTSGFPTPAANGRVLVGDFNGDGNADILYQTGGNGTAFRFARSNGDGTFTLLDLANSPFAGLSLVDHTGANYRVGDFDGDGDLDIFAATNGSFGNLYLNNSTPPKLVSATPADNSTGVSPSANIVLTFSQSVTKGAGSIQIVDTRTNQVVETISAASASVTGSGTTWTIDPSITLASGVSYAVRIDSKAFANAAGNAYAGIKNNTALNFTVASNAPPVVANLNGDAVSYTEKSSGVLLDQGSNAVVTDADSANFNGGSVRVAVTGGAVNSEDVLSISSSGTGAGQISVSGSNVLYGGVAIGTYTGGTGGNPMMVTLNANADAGAVTALVRSIQYSNSNTTAPNTGARTLSVVVSDDTGTASTAAAVTVNLFAVNDAPVVSVTSTNPTFTEDGSAVALFSGTSISTVESGQSITLMTISVSNLANGASEKLVIDGSEVTLTAGTNLVTLNNGMSVTVSVSAGAATVTMTHAGLSTATVQTIVNNVAYRNDSDAPVGTSRTVTLTNVRDSGGTLYGGQNTRTVDAASIVTLVAVNDAPTLSGGPYVLPSTNENTISAAASVSTILAGTGYADADNGAISGIAVTATVGRGTWQYSTDGTTWTAFGTVSTSSALLLASTTQVRYIPDAANGENVSITYRAWDRTSGAASTNGMRSTGDTTANGGTTAYSAGTAFATLIVTSANDAPVMTPVNPVMTSLTDGSINNSGDAVSTLLGGVTDVDTGALKGIAVTGLSSTYGKWQFSTNNGASWNDVGTVSDTAALILRPADRLRFVPDGIHGETATISYKAWDQTNGTQGLQGTQRDTTPSGGTSAYSSATDTATVVVTAVNDAPVLTGTSGSVVWTEGNNVASTPVAVDPTLTLSDPDGPGIASATVGIIGNYASGEDVLGFSNDNTSLYGDIAGSWNAGTGTLTLISAGGTASQAQFQQALRAVTYTNTSDTPTTTLRSVGFVVNDGGLDSNTVSRSVLLVSINDAPVIMAPTHIIVTEDTLSPVTGILVSDVDSASGTLTLTVGAGNLSAISANGVTVGGTATARTLTGSLGAINDFIAAGSLKYTPALNSNTSVTLGLSMDTGSAGTDTRSVTIDITPVNDSPTISGPVSINVTEDVAKSMAGITFGDVDAGTGSVRVIFSVANGNGTFTATASSGVTATNSGTNAITLEGTVADINTLISNGRLTFLGALNATGVKTMSISINDNGNTGSGGALQVNANISLVIAAVNDAPVNNLPAQQTMLQDGALVFNAVNGNLISITDVDIGGNVMKLTLSATDGRLTLGSIVGLSFTTGDGTNDSAMTFTGTLAAINAALNGLAFTPTAGFTGAATITFESDDQGYSGAGGVKTDFDTLAITVEPSNPRVAGVQAPLGSNGIYKVGDQIDISVDFDYDVMVDMTDGTPTLLLETGAIDRQAVYVSGSGGKTLTFRYVVQAGDTSADLDYASTAALQLNGATLKSTTGYDAVTTLPTVGGAQSLAGQQAIVIDGVAPQITSVIPPSDGNYRLGQNLDFTVNFSEAVTVGTGGGTPRIAVTLDTGGTVYASYVSGSGTSALVFRLAVASGQLDANGIDLGSSVQLNGGTLRDLAGNDAATGFTAGNTAGVLVDGVVPAVVGVALPTDGSYAAGQVLRFTVSASEAVVTGAIAPRLVLDIGGQTRYANYVSGSGSAALVFEYTVQAGDNAGLGIGVSGINAFNGEPLTDLAGNEMLLALNGVGSGAGVLIDTTAPSASGIVRVDATPTNNGSVRFTVTFSENVSGVDAADFSLVTTGGAYGNIASVTRVDGKTYSVLVDTLMGTGTVGLNLNASGTGIADAAGNAVSGGLTGATYSVDRIAPRVIGVDVPPDATYVAGQTLNFRVRMSEAVLVDTTGGTPRLAITLDTGGTVYADYLASAGSETLVFRMVVASGQLDADGISIGALELNGATLRDATGNDSTLTLNGVGATGGVKIDAVLPTATITLADTALKAGETSRVTIEFSEAVSGLTADDFNVSGGTLSAPVTDNGGRSWTATFTPAANTTQAQNVITLRSGTVTDAAGNANSGATDSANYAVDTQRPTALITVADTALKAGETSLVTIAFSEAVLTLESSDFAIDGGTLTGLSSDNGGLTWTGTFTPTADVEQAAGAITLKGGSVSDAAGNVNLGATPSNSYAIDTRLPTATITLAQDALAIGETSLVTITFSEPVTGFDNSDLQVANGTLSAVESRDGGRTWTATFTPTADVSDTSNVIVLDQSGVRDLAGNAGSGISDSGNYAIDTQRPTASITLDDAALKAGETAQVTIAFSEAITGLELADFSVSGGELSNLLSNDGGKTWSATFTPGTDVEQTGNVIALRGGAVSDLAGNAIGATTESPGFAIDTRLPTAAITLDATALKAGETSQVSIAFSEAVQGLELADFDVAGGTLSNLVSNDGGKTWSAAFTPGAGVEQGGNVIALRSGAVTDLAGNAISATTESPAFAIDTLLPTANITLDTQALKGGETAQVKIAFSEAVQGLDLADFDVAGGQLSNLQSSDGGKTWTATFTPGADVQQTGTVIALRSGAVTDAAGNAIGATTESPALAIDTQLPTANITLDAQALKAGETARVTITFSEAVDGLELADFDVAGGVLSNLQSNDGGKTWTATFTPDAGVEQGGNVIALRSGAVTDLAGNAISATTESPAFGIDTLLPTASITLDAQALKGGETAQVKIAFSEAVQGLDLADFDVAGGQLSNLQSNDGGKTWTATFTPGTDVQQAGNVIALRSGAVTDAAGNAISATTRSPGFAVDTRLPTATIGVNADELLAGQTAQVNIVFSEAVQGLDLGDFSVANGTLSDLRSTDGGITWTATLTPAEGVQADANLIRLNNAGYTDLAGNAGVGETGSQNYAVATTPLPATVPAAAPIEVPAAPAVAMFSPAPVETGMGSGGIGFLSAVNNGGSETLTVLSSPLALALAGFPDLAPVFLDSSERAAPPESAVAPYVPQRLPAASAAGEGLQLLRSVNDLSIGDGGSLTWQVPANVFGHTNPLAVVTLSMTLADGRPLPSWVKFDARTGTLQVQAPEGFRGELVLQLTARDDQGREVKTTVKLKPGAQTVARAGLAEQFQRAALQRGGNAVAQRLHA